MSCTLLTVVAVALLCTVAAAQEAPVKPVWPRRFNVDFGLYVEANLQGAGNAPIINATSGFYYDYTDAENPRNIILYPETCIPVPGAMGVPCNLTFTKVGTYIATADFCCLLFPGIPPLPPAFLSGFTWSGLPSLPAMDWYGQVWPSNLWVGTADPAFTYSTRVGDGEDVSLVDGGAIQWNYKMPLRQDPQPSNIYDISPTCASTCNPELADAVRAHEPMVKMTHHHHNVVSRAAAATTANVNVVA